MTCPHCDSGETGRRGRRTSLGYRTFVCRACRSLFNERTGAPFNDLQFPNDVVLLAVMWRRRYKLGFREVAEWLLERGYEVTHETRPRLGSALRASALRPAAEQALGSRRPFLVHRRDLREGLRPSVLPLPGD